MFVNQILFFKPNDVVVQNVNIISSPACNVLYFKKHHRVSPMKCFMLETYPFAVMLSTKLPSSSPLSSTSSLLSSSSMLTSPSSSLSSSSLSLLNPSLLSLSSVSLYISLTSEVRLSPSFSYLNSSVFFNYLLFIIYLL